MLVEISLLLALTTGGHVTMGTDSQGTKTEAQRLQAQGKLDQARDLYEQALSLDPEDADAQAGMSITSERLSLDERAAGHMDAALADLVRAQRVEPNDKRILYDLGILEDEMALYIDAAATLEHLESLKPVDPSLLYALARVNMNLGKLDAAQEEMQAYLKVWPLDASAHFGLGSIYLRGLQFDKAEQELQQSIVIQPKQSEAYYQLGQVYLEQNRFEDSIRQFHKALERNAQHGGALEGIGVAYFKLKQYEQAYDWLTKATKAAPEYQPGHYYLGLTLARLGETTASRRELEIATTLAGKDSKQSATRLRLYNPDGQL
jgi:tetratricopeptide (TPR) repeat protein